MDFDKLKVYGDTSITDGLVFIIIQAKFDALVVEKWGNIEIR